MDDEILTAIESGLALLGADDREQPNCTSDRYYDIHREIAGLAFIAGRIDVMESLGTMPEQFLAGDYRTANKGIRKILRDRLNYARECVLTTTQTERHYDPGPCPACGAKLYVASTRELVRHLACKNCDYTGKRPV